jgi:hypothetical protein
MTDILTRLEQTTKINGAYPQDIKDAIEEIMKLRGALVDQSLSRIDIIGQNGNSGEHYNETE